MWKVRQRKTAQSCAKVWHISSLVELAQCLVSLARFLLMQSTFTNYICPTDPPRVLGPRCPGAWSRGIGIAIAPRRIARRTFAWRAGIAARSQRAKRVIWLTMAGGPSQLELFDYKPKLAAMDGKPMPESFTAGQQLAQLQGQKLVCKGPMFSFKKHGKCGMELSELLPHIGSVADEICLIRSMTTDAINHDPAHMFMNTGAQIAGRPSMGAWVTYGLGSMAEDLPGFVGTDVHWQRTVASTHRCPAVEQWVFTVQVPGRPAALAGRSRAVFDQPRRHHSGGPRHGC